MKYLNARVHSIHKVCAVFKISDPTRDGPQYFSSLISFDDGITMVRLQLNQIIHSSHENYINFFISNKIQFITYSKLYYTLGFLILLYSKMYFI